MIMKYFNPFQAHVPYAFYRKQKTWKGALFQKWDILQIYMGETNKQ